MLGRGKVRSLAMTSPFIIAGIDVTRSSSGGAEAHILEILAAADPIKHGISKVVVWANSELGSKLPARDWLEVRRPFASDWSLIKKISWQKFILPNEAAACGVSVMFQTDAASVCRFSPSVVLSQDMLPFEYGERQRYRYLSRHFFSRLKLEFSRRIQINSFVRAEKVVFLSDRAAKVISEAADIASFTVIPHGVSTKFSDVSLNTRAKVLVGEAPTILYVSHVTPYKHQWNVVDAVARIRSVSGISFKLRLVGGLAGSDAQRLQTAIQRFDPALEYVCCTPKLSNDEIPAELAACDIFVFASSCENLPITLLEAMRAGALIVCSNKGPMPDVLRDGGVYFDPDLPCSLVDALNFMLSNKELHDFYRHRAKALSDSYSWQSAATATWETLAECAGNYHDE